MTYVYILYFAFVVAIGLWAWVLRPDGWRAGLTVGLLPVTYLAFVLAGAEILSRPKPMPMAWFEAVTLDEDIEVTVRSARMVEGEAIHLWLDVPWSAAPRAYSLPWDQKRAEELQKAMEEAEQKPGSQVKMRKPFVPWKRSLESSKMFYPDPPPAPPLKRP